MFNSSNISVFVLNITSKAKNICYNTVLPENWQSRSCHARATLDLLSNCRAYPLSNLIFDRLNRGEGRHSVVENRRDKT